MVYYISLFSKIRCSLTYLPTQKSDVICECSLTQCFGLICFFLSIWMQKSQYFVPVYQYTTCLWPKFRRLGNHLFKSIKGKNYIYFPGCRKQIRLVFFCQNCSDLLWDKNCSSDWEKILKFEAEGREFANNWDH